MAVNESKLDMLKKRIERREQIIKDETAKLKKEKEDYAKAKSAAMAEYMEKENIEFNDDFKKRMDLAAKILASGVSNDDIADFFSLSNSESIEKIADTSASTNLEV